MLYYQNTNKSYEIKIQYDIIIIIKILINIYNVILHNHEF